MSGSASSAGGGGSEAEDRCRWAALIEHLPGMITLANRRREICWVNRVFTEHTGWSLDEVRGRNPRSFLHGPRTNPSTVARLERLLDEGQAVTDFEILEYKKSGETYWASLSIRPIVDACGDLVEFLTVETDITARKLREAQMRLTEHRLAQALRLARASWLEHELSSGRARCPTELLEYLGLDPGAAADLQMADLTPLTHPDDAERVRAAYAQAINGGGEFESEHRVRTAAGDVRWGHVRGVLEGWEDGSPAVFRLVLQDITEREKAERLGRERAAGAAAARSQIDTLAGLTDELREPLQAVLGFTAMVERSDGNRLSASGCARLRQIDRAGRELLRVVEDAADLARLRSGRVSIEASPVDLHALAVEAAAAVETEAASRRIGVDVVPASKHGLVIGDPWLLRQLLAQLIGHALRRSGAGGSIEVLIAPAAAGRVRLEVSDSGCGMAAERMAQLFDPFRRDAGADPAEVGAGLRLATCRAVVEGMGGTVHAEAAARGGVAIVVELPAAGETVVPIARAAAVTDGEARRPRDRACVLVIGEGLGADRPADVLPGRRRLDLCVRHSGAEGLAAVHGLRPDLLLVDLDLPDMTGIEFLQQMRADAVLRRVPCAAVTADEREETVAASLRGGFCCCLGKPVAAAELFELLDRLAADRAD